MSQPLHIEGAKALLPHGLEECAVTVAEGRIAALGEAAPEGAARVDGRGMILAPAMVDIHGDGFERQIMPRPNVFFPTDLALLDADRQLAGCGIATAYHALTLSWEPGLRSVARGAEIIAALTALRPRCAVENRVQLRWEIFCSEALELIEEALAGPLPPSIAFNDHTTMSMRAFDMKVTERPFEMADADIAPLSDDRMRQRSAGNAKRAGLSEDAYIALLGEVWARRPEVDGMVARIAASGRAAGAPMLSHDDSQPEMRLHYADLGARIAEFPMCLATAREAKARGEWVALGAPNAARGGSHIGSLHAGDMVEDGVCDILASDYFHPAMLAAVARLHAEMRAPLHRLWACVSANPAASHGLADRGEIAPGKRADLVLLDWPDQAAPAPVLTLCEGRIAFRAEARGA